MLIRILLVIITLTFTPLPAAFAAGAEPERRTILADGHPVALWEKSAAGATEAILLVHGKTWSALPDFDPLAPADMQVRLLLSLPGTSNTSPYPAAIMRLFLKTDQVGPRAVIDGVEHYVIRGKNICEKREADVVARQRTTADRGLNFEQVES